MVFLKKRTNLFWPLGAGLYCQKISLAKCPVHWPRPMSCVNSLLLPRWYLIVPKNLKENFASGTIPKPPQTPPWVAMTSSSWTRFTRDICMATSCLGPSGVSFCSALSSKSFSCRPQSTSTFSETTLPERRPSYRCRAGMHNVEKLRMNCHPRFQISPTTFSLITFFLCESFSKLCQGMLR